MVPSPCCQLAQPGGGLAPPIQAEPQGATGTEEGRG